MENLNAGNIINEIQSLIKALKDCGGWVKRGNGEGWFNHDILVDALALITSQEQRIKGLEQCLEHEHASFMETFGEYGEKCERLAEENERLKKTLEENTDSCLEFYKSVNEQIEVSKKAIVEETTNRTFARFARYFGTYTDNDMVKIRDIFELLDKFAKEMLEGGE